MPQPPVRGAIGRFGACLLVVAGVATPLRSGSETAVPGLPGQASTQASDASYRLYLASIAAADASLRLHDTAAARRWLEEAPPAHRGWEWRYLERLSDESALVIRAHEGVVNDVEVSAGWRSAPMADSLPLPRRPAR